MNRRLVTAGRKARDVRRDDYVKSHRLELVRQRESRLRPSGGIGRDVLGPSGNPDRGFAQYNVDTIRLHLSAKCRQGPLTPRLGLGRGAIDQVRGLLRDQMLEPRPLLQRYRPSSEPSSEIDERKRKQNGRRIEEQ